MIINYFSFRVLIIFLLVGVGFLTLLERKFLGYIQYRKGPNKLGMGGVIQPFRDAIKLFCKESLMILKSNCYLYHLTPIILMFIMVMNWSLFPWITNLYYMNYSMLLMFVFLRVGGHVLLLIG